jgi:hypothetical protein
MSLVDTLPKREMPSINKAKRQLLLCSQKQPLITKEHFRLSKKSSNEPDLAMAEECDRLIIFKSHQIRLKITLASSRY